MTDLTIQDVYAALVSDSAMWKWKIATAASFLNVASALHGKLHSLDQSGAGFGRQFHECTHGGDLIMVLLHAPVEGSAIFRADQRLRRTHTLGRVRHVEPMCIDHVVEVATALFFDTKTVNALCGITSEDS